MPNMRLARLIIFIASHQPFAMVAITFTCLISHCQMLTFYSASYVITSEFRLESIDVFLQRRGGE